MSKKYELDRLAAVRRDTEEKLFNIQVNLDSLNNDIIFLTHMEKQLGENIEVLRQEKVITLAPEFRKIRCEKQVVANRLALLRKDQNALRIALSNGQNFLKTLEDQYQELMSSIDDNVIHVNFGRQADGG